MVPSPRKAAGRPLTSGPRGLGRAALPLAQLAVQHQQARTILAHHAKLLGQQPTGLFLLHLLLHEPIEEDGAGEVPLVHREPVDLVDAGGDLLLVLVGLTEDVARRGEVGGRAGERLELHLAAPVEHVIEDLHRVLGSPPAPGPASTGRGPGRFAPSQ